MPPPTEYCDCLFRSVYSALHAHPELEQKVRVYCIDDLMRRVLNEPGSVWTTGWEGCYGGVYDHIVSRGVSCLRVSPWVERFFALDTLRTRRMFVQLARHHVLERMVHATEPECLAVGCFLEAHGICLVLQRTPPPIRPPRGETNGCPCIHLFRNERGHFNPILDVRHARSALPRHDALHRAFFVAWGGALQPAVAAVAAPAVAADAPDAPPDAPDAAEPSESVATPSSSPSHDPFTKMIMRERRILLKKLANVQARIEARLIQTGYTRCELHHRNRRVVHIRSKPRAEGRATDTTEP